MALRYNVAVVLAMHAAAFGPRAFAAPLHSLGHEHIANVAQASCAVDAVAAGA